MATADDGRATSESGGAGVNFRKTPFQQENSSGVSELSTHQCGNSSVTAGILELETMLKQMTLTRYDAQRLIALVHSRIMEESPSPLPRLEASTTTSGSLRQNSKLINSNATQHSTTMESLPDELLVNIFIRLLAKQLAQMRSVSKSWNALLSQSSFVKSHLHRSIHDNHQIFLVFNDIFSDCDFKSFTAHSGQSPHLELTNLSNFIKLPLNPQPAYTSIRVIGSVNGLICSSYGDSVIHIWNPSLSAVLTLNILPLYPMPSRFMDISFRFGFDLKTDDYKVIKLTGLNRPSSYHIKSWLQAEIYSMRKGSWELVTKRFPSHITAISDDSFIGADGHNGYLHWLCSIGEHYDPDRIVAFDLGSETFRELPLPHSTVYEYNRLNYIGVLGGKLCVMSSDEDVGSDVWVMDEYGVAESWVKRHVFPRDAGDYIYSFGSTSHNNFLIYEDVYLGLYDPIANKETILENSCLGKYGTYTIVEYVDSLVWIAASEREMVDDAGQN